MPETTDGTVNVALIPPDPSAYVVTICDEPRLMLTKPFGVNPEPVQDTVSPGRAVEGTTVTEPIVIGKVGVGYWVEGCVAVEDGVAVVVVLWVTVNVAVAVAPETSYAVTVYIPRETDGTVNVALMSPDPSASGVATCTEPKLMIALLPNEKPDPVICDFEPAEPCAGFNVRVVWAVTVNVVEAETPTESPAVTA